MRLQDKVVVVTASTRGIGLAIVEACAKEGAIVYMAARNLEKAQAIADRLNENGGRVRTVYNDASKQETHSSMIADVVADAGRIDVLVNNFGSTDVSRDRDFLHTNYSDFKEILDLNLASVYLTSQAAASEMAKQGGGSIINISSIGGQIPDVARISYAVAKDAIIYLSKNMAFQLGRANVRVNVVCPGQTATDAVKDNMPQHFQEIFTRHTPIKRMGLPEENAATVVHLASDESAYTTGQVIAVSGGFGLGTPVYADLIDFQAQKQK